MNSYALMMEHLDRYWENADISAYSIDAQAFLGQAYWIIKALVADVQRLQAQQEEKAKCL